MSNGLLAVVSSLFYLSVANWLSVFGKCYEKKSKTVRLTLRTGIETSLFKCFLTLTAKKEPVIKQ